MANYKYLIFRTKIYYDCEFTKTFTYECLCGCGKNYSTKLDLRSLTVDECFHISHKDRITRQNIKQIYESICNFDHIEDIFNYLIIESIVTKNDVVSSLYKLSLNDWSVENPYFTIHRIR